MTDALLWDLEETARQLGNVSSRTVLRMIARGEIASKIVGRRRMVVSQSVRNWLDGGPHPAHTERRVERDVRGVNACQKHAGRSATVFIDAQTRQTTGLVTSTRVEKELDDLLAPAIRKKPRRCSQNGESKRGSRSTGGLNPPGSSR